jgi:hypothetical protein
LVATVRGLVQCPPYRRRAEYFVFQKKLEGHTLAWWESLTEKLRLEGDPLVKKNGRISKSSLIPSYTLLGI